MEKLQNELSSFLREKGAADVGFCRVDDAPSGLRNAVSIVVRMSDAVIDEIEDSPTYTYFHHYRTVNAFLDRLALECGIWLSQRGYNYLPIAASQSVPAHLGKPYRGRYSHKKVARLAGLGGIGKNALFLHRDYGARVRLVTVFTDCAFENSKPELSDLCTGCDKCVSICPAGAISGENWEEGKSDFFDAEKCSAHMKTAYQNIGRGAVCGLCMRVCPVKDKKRG